MSDNVIEIRGIIRDFKLGQETVHVLKGIDLDIKRGEYVPLWDLQVLVNLRL